jgi:hypothetical protein
MEFMVVEEAVRQVFLPSHRFFLVVNTPQISYAHILLIFIGCSLTLVIDSAVKRNTLQILYSQFYVIQKDSSDICMKTSSKVDCLHLFVQNIIYLQPTHVHYITNVNSVRIFP